MAAADAALLRQHSDQWRHPRQCRADLCAKTWQRRAD
jgi:hypothetical protein